MISKPKTLITLTVLNPLSDTNVKFAVTDGDTTLNGATGIAPYLENNFLSTVQELLQGHPVNPAGPADFLYGNWPERLVKFAIDPELIKEMIVRYQKNGNDSSITKLDEWFINFFDKVNGNTAVSSSVGIAHLVKGISTGEFSLEDEPEKKPIPQIRELIELMFYQDPWDHESQGLKILTGKVPESSEDIEFNVVHAVGNVYMEGRIGKLGIRVFKNQNIQAYIGWGTDYPDRPEVFQLAHPQVFEQRLYEIAELSATTPA